MQYRRLGEEPDPAGVRPEQDDVSFGQQARVELRTHLLCHVVQFIEVAEEHRHHLHGQGGGVNLRQTPSREQTGIQVARLHQADHVRFAALRAAREDDQLHGAIRGFAPLLPHRLEALVIRGAGRRESAQLEPNGLFGGVEARRGQGGAEQ
jgi:hypothetical protein